MELEIWSEILINYNVQYLSIMKYVIVISHANGNFIGCHGKFICIYRNIGED